MSQLSMNEMTTYRWSFEEDVSHYKEAGIDVIGVWRQKLSDYGEDRGIELLCESGMKVSNLLWAGGFTGSDGRRFRDSIDDAIEAVELAAQMHAHCVVLYTGGRGAHIRSHVQRLIRDAMAEVVGVATELHVTLALEPMHANCAGEWTIVTDLDAACCVLDEFDSPFLKLVFDTYHLGHDRRILNRIGQIAGRIAVVHLGDARLPPEKEQNRARLGRGALPLQEIVDALIAAGYDGYYDVELLGEDFHPDHYFDLLDHSKQAFGELTRQHAVGRSV